MAYPYDNTMNGAGNPGGNFTGGLPVAGRGGWAQPPQQPTGGGVAYGGTPVTANSTQPLSSLMAYNQRQGGQPFTAAGMPYGDPTGGSQPFSPAGMPYGNPGGNPAAGQFDWMQFLRTMGYGGMPGMAGGGGGWPRSGGGQSPWNMLNPQGWGGQMPQLGAYRPQFGGAGYVNQG